MNVDAKNVVYVLYTDCIHAVDSFLDGVDLAIFHFHPSASLAVSFKPCCLCWALGAIPLLIFDPSVYRWYLLLLICCVPCLFCLPDSSLLLVDISGSGMCCSESHLPACCCRRRVRGQDQSLLPVPGWRLRLDAFNSTISRSLHGWESSLKSTCMSGLL